MCLILTHVPRKQFMLGCYTSVTAICYQTKTSLRGVQRCPRNSWARALCPHWIYIQWQDWVLSLVQGPEEYFDVCVLFVTAPAAVWELQSQTVSINEWSQQQKTRKTQLEKKQLQTCLSHSLITSGSCSVYCHWCGSYISCLGRAKWQYQQRQFTQHYAQVVSCNALSALLMPRGRPRLKRLGLFTLSFL